MAQRLSAPPPTVLAIAGFDPSCGAGIGADLKTIAACGAYGIGAITAITIQNTQKITGIFPVESHVLHDQILHLIEDITPAAVKIGMIFTRANVQVLTDLVQRHLLSRVVLDPVLRSSTGTSLLCEDAWEDFKVHLLPLADCLTPNIDEAALISGRTIRNVEEMKLAAKDIVAMGCKTVVVTGGHLHEATDVLYDGESFHIFAAEKIDSRATHGTGCTFSSALASCLARGFSLQQAVEKAKSFVRSAIHQAVPIGHGNGPLKHFFE